MEKIKNLEDVRNALAEIAEIAWKDKTFLGRATVATNALGKIITSVAVEVKAAEISKRAVDSHWITMSKEPKEKFQL